MSASTTFRNNATVDKTEPRLIPGAMLGGESLAIEKGATLDDVKLQAVWADSQHFTVHSDLMAHQVSGETAFELESFWLNLDSQSLPLGLEIAFGKMNTKATQSATWHASQFVFSEAPLLSDVFWGRHFSDTGMRLSRSVKGVSVGVEAWNGDSWPASVGEGSADAYIHLAQAWGFVSLRSGAWVMGSKAENRMDTRYGAGHSHGGLTISNPVSDFAFTGDILTRGAFIDLTFPLKGLELNGNFELIAQSYDGEVQNTNQNSAFEANYQGIRFEMSATSERHTVSASYESLNFENHFYGSVTQLFVSGAGLLNNGFEPEKTSLAWNFQWKPELTFRTEWVADKSVSEEAVNRLNFGFRWSHEWCL